MPKEIGSDADFVAAFRSNRAKEVEVDGSTQRMKLRSFPTGPKLSMEEMLAAEEQRTVGASSGSPFPGQTAVQIDHTAMAATEGSRGRGRYVPMSALHSHPWNARVHRPLARIHEIASQMASGQNSPVLITANPDNPGSYFVVDGETRHQAAKILGWPEIWVLDIDVDPADPQAFFLESYRHTNATEPISPIDQGIRFKALIDAGAATIDSLAKGMDTHRSSISRMLSYSRFPEQVLSYMHQHQDRFSYSIAATLAPLAERLPDEEELLAYCHQIVEAELSRRDIDAYVKGSIAEKKTRERRRSPLISRVIKSSAGTIGAFRTFESGALEFKLNPGHGLSDAELTKLIDLLSQTTDSLSAQSGSGKLATSPRKPK